MPNGKRCTRSCYALNCKVKKYAGSEVTLHKFPKDPERCRIWVEWANNPKLFNRSLNKLYKSVFLCQHHFTRDQYFNFARRRLLPEAVPTVPPPIDPHSNGPSSAFSEKTPSSGSTSAIPPFLSSANAAENELSTASNIVEHPKSATADLIEISLNDALSLTPKAGLEDNASEESNDEIQQGIDDSLLDAPQATTPRYICQSNHDPSHVIEEPPELYALITLPYLEQANLHLEWVYKILSGEEGQERIVYESPNKDDKDSFLIIKDSKWDCIDLDRLHLIAIAYRPGILSIRDLTEDHLHLLQNIYSKGKEVIKKKYGIVGSQLRIFLPYQPPFYHLNVHFTANNDDVCGSYYAHPLHSVINNIQLFPTYYQVASLTLCLKESDDLFQKFEAHGIVERLQMTF